MVVGSMERISSVAQPSCPVTASATFTSLAACRGARAAKMRVVGVYDTFFAQDEWEMRGFCDVYIKSFEELLWLPEQKARKK